MSHAAQSIKNWDIPGLVGNSLDKSDPVAYLTPDSIIESGTSQSHFRNIHKDIYGDSALTHEVIRGNSDQGVGYNDHTGHIATVWKRFSRLICGQEGPFSRGGVRKKPDQVAKLCHNLWPAGPPQNGDKWRSPVGYSPDDFAMNLSPLPILTFTSVGIFRFAPVFTLK